MKKMTLGDLQLAPTGQTVRLKGQSATKARSEGKADLFSVSSSTWELSIAYCRWDNRDQDVRLYDRGRAPQRFDRFRSARRLGVHPASAGEWYVDLMQARMSENDHPVLRKVELAELSVDAHCDVQEVLIKMGAKVGTRESLIRDTSRHGSRYCARFPAHATEIAVVAYVLTRIAPFHHEIRA